MSNDLISRNAFRERLLAAKTDLSDCHKDGLSMDAITFYLDNQPAIEVNQALPAEWVSVIEVDECWGDMELSQCSHCGTIEYSKRNYCAECGSIMKNGKSRKETMNNEGCLN